MINLLTFIRIHWISITLLILAAITALSLWPLQSLPSVPGTDKIHHLIAYAGLILPMALRQPKHWLLICLFLIGWGGAIEIVQPYANRYGEWLDVAANTAGVVCGLLIAQLINHLCPISSNRQPKSNRE